MLFITFEGIDGSGKSTQAELLVERLEDAGRKSLLLREPGGTELSERVRTLLLEPSLPINDFAELLLFSAARAQLVSERIRPALRDGAVVVCDRFYDSTTAYQGAGRMVAELSWVKDLNRHVTGGLAPDRTYLIALQPEAAARRRDGRTGAADEPVDRMEQSDESFYRRVCAAYDQMAAEEPERFKRLDGTRTIDDLSEEIWLDVERILEHRDGTASSG